MRSSKRHGSLECLALVCVACTPCTNTAAPPEAHFSSHCSTKSIGQSGGPTPTTEGDHTTTTHKDTEQQHATCCLHVLCCNCFLCSDAYGMSWNQHGQSHRVRLIPHLSSPLLEPPVKVGSQGVLAIQLTAIGTHALQAVGPQDWPMALYTIFCRTFGLPSHTANVQLPRHGPTSSLFSQAHSARSGRSQASLLPTMPI